MTSDEILKYCLTKRKAYVDYPFGEIPVVVKVKGKIFAELYPKENDRKLTLKCEPMLADFYRREYAGIIVRGYHCPPVQQPHRNTVYYEKLTDELVKNMIDMSYNEVLNSFSKKKQAEILSE